MKILKRMLSNQLGMSLVMVLVIVTGALASIGYLTVNLIPKLQDGKKKAEQAIQYRIFIGSLNDYIVHGIRERWCITAGAVTDGFVETDMLIANSTSCASTVPMEDVVRFKGNLERILWDNQTIGNTGGTSPITIIGLNHARRQPPTPKTAVTLTYEDVAPADKTMKFRIPESVFTNMSDVHPLYTISKGAKNCFEHVDIEIAKNDVGSTGDEVKLRISIEAKMKLLPLSCLAHHEVKSTTFYTFYPRRLHNFALIKYDDLDAGKYNEFYGPVYLAGSLKLPADDTNKDKSTIFYDSLTLGTFNGSDYKPGVYKTGDISNADGTPYTFTDRGDPYKSKQDSYETFRGIMGGLRLDAIEDKGLFNIFKYDATNSQNVQDLENCIEDTKVKTTPSVNDGTLLAYSEVADSQSSSPGTVQFKTGLTKRNRFKPSINAPALVTDPPDTAARKFIVNVPTPANGVKSIGSLRFFVNGDNDFLATMGNSSSVEIKIDLAKYDLTTAMLDTSIALLDAAVSTKATYQDVIPAGHLLRSLPEYSSYKTKTENLLDKCDQNNKGSIAHCVVPFPTDYTATITCIHTTDPQCDQQNKYDDYISGKSTLRNKLNTIRTAIAAAGDAQITLSLTGFQNSNSKDIINQSIFKASITDKWKTVFPLLNLDPLIEFTGFHYGLETLMFKIEVVDSSELIRLKKQNNGNLVDFDNFSDWKNTYDNSNISLMDDPEEITEMSCPGGMGFADWDFDMSGSTNFAWNYANAPAGANVDTTNHDSLPDHKFLTDPNLSGSIKGTDKELTKSVVNDCFISKTREFVYGFYACRKLTIEGDRTKALNIIGTFIVRDLVINENVWPIRWHSVWTPMARDLVLTELNSDNTFCATANDLVNKTMKDIAADFDLEQKIKKCSSQELVTNGPNNFTWTTTDPDIGIAPEFPTMTSQKVRRYLRWVMREDSRKDTVK